MASKKRDIRTDVRTKKTVVKAKAAGIKEKRRKRIAKVKSLASRGAQNTVTDNRLELLVTIVSRSKGEYYIDLLQSFEINMQFVTLGRGTADADMLSRLGFDDSDKTVIIGVIQENKIKDALETLEQKFRTIKNGKGIAYTVPLSSMIGTLLFGFLSNNRMAVKPQEN